MELFDEMEEKGIAPTQVTYSVTISALGNGLQWERALQLLNTMREKGMGVNLITYNAGESILPIRSNAFDELRGARVVVLCVLVEYLENPL